MKRFLFIALIALTSLSLFTSCDSVDSGYSAGKRKWGGEIDMTQVYPEGMYYGISYLFDELVPLDVREKTIVNKFQFNDRSNMNTGVELALDYSLMRDKVNYIISRIGEDQIPIKISKTLKSAAKEVVSQYTASELNLSKRTEAEQQIGEILTRELPEFYVNFVRVQLTDVDIPDAISKTAEMIATQKEKTKLSLERANEAENNYKTAEWDAKTKDALSKPEMLKLKQLEIQEKWIEKWNGSFGSNNVFGEGSAVILKGK